MTKSDELWLEDKIANGWSMPSAPSWKRLSIIRHIRAAYHSVKVSEHERIYRSMGMIPNGYDRWVIYGIRRGWEPDQ